MRSTETLETKEYQHKAKRQEFTMLGLTLHKIKEDLMTLTEEMISSITLKSMWYDFSNIRRAYIGFWFSLKRLPFTTAVSEATGFSEEDSWEPQVLRQWWIEPKLKDAEQPQTSDNGRKMV